MVNNKGIKVTDKHVLFWGGWPSNWFKASFTLEDGEGNPMRFATTEQYFMHRKAMMFHDKETADKILATNNPRKAKELGRQVRNYNDDLWNEKRYQIMFTANLYKYNQNKELMDALTSDELRDKTFVEASPYDRIWGIGIGMEDDASDDEKMWKGQNLLGKCLTELRDIFMKSAASK